MSTHNMTTWRNKTSISTFWMENSIFSGAMQEDAWVDLSIHCCYTTANKAFSD